MSNTYSPHYISIVWRGFMKKLYVTLSLAYEYHPQSNGQEECIKQ